MQTSLSGEANACQEKTQEIPNLSCYQELVITVARSNKDETN